MKNSSCLEGGLEGCDMVSGAWRCCHFTIKGFGYRQSLPMRRGPSIQFGGDRFCQCVVVPEPASAAWWGEVTQDVSGTRAQVL